MCSSVTQQIYDEHAVSAESYAAQRRCQLVDFRLSDSYILCQSPPLSFAQTTPAVSVVVLLAKSETLLTICVPEGRLCPDDIGSQLSITRFSRV